jgi:hypothetical protein
MACSIPDSIEELGQHLLDGTFGVAELNQPLPRPCLRHRIQTHDQLRMERSSPYSRSLWEARQKTVPRSPLKIQAPTCPPIESTEISSTRFGLDRLPPDTLEQIFSYLSGADLVSLCICSKILLASASTNQLWCNLVIQDFPADAHKYSDDVTSQTRYAQCFCAAVDSFCRKATGASKALLAWAFRSSG